MLALFRELKSPSDKRAMRPDLIRAIELLRKPDAVSVSDALGLLQSTVYAFSMKVCGHPQDAEDTMQDVLLGSLPYLAKITDPKALAVWLYTVTRNRCWRSRRRSVHAPNQTLSLGELMPNDNELAELLQSPQSSPEKQVLAKEQNEILHEAILSLPPEYRMVLALHDLEDLDTEQVAQVLDLQPGTVRVRLHRARLFVRKTMAELGRGDAERQPGMKASRSPRRKLHKERPKQCNEVFANLSEYLDDRLSPDTCEQMRSHIDACPGCVAFIGDLRQAIDRCKTLHSGCDVDLAPKLRSMLTKEYLRLVNIPAVER